MLHVVSALALILLIFAAGQAIMPGVALGCFTVIGTVLTFNMLPERLQKWMFTHIMWVDLISMAALAILFTKSQSVTGEIGASVHAILFAIYLRAKNAMLKAQGNDSLIAALMNTK